MLRAVLLSRPKPPQVGAEGQPLQEHSSQRTIVRQGQWAPLATATTPGCRAESTASACEIHPLKIQKSHISIINALVRRIRSRATSVLRKNCSRSATGSLACFLIDPRPGLCRTASSGSRADRHAQTASGCDTADMRHFDRHPPISTTLWRQWN